MIRGFSAECMACVVGKRHRAMPLEWTGERRSAYLRQVMRIILEADPDEPSPSVVRRIDRVSEEWGIPGRDFGEAKRVWNRKMLALAPALREEIRSAPDPLARAVQFARIANYIDFGALTEVSEEQLMALLRRAPEEDLDPAEYECLRRDLCAADTLAYLTDNCGEIVLDLLLLEQIRALRPSIRATVIARGQPVSNDATAEDAREIGMDAVAEVLGNGNGLMGTFLEAMDPLSRARFEGADVALAKGLANFETLVGCGRNVYYLFLCKCENFERLFHMRRMHGVLVNDRRLTNEMEGMLR